MKHLHIDFETYSEADLKAVGMHKYVADPSFEILIVAYAFDNEPVQCVAWKDAPQRLLSALTDPAVLKIAHNAAFERACLAAVGYASPVEQWRCSMVKALYCGLPGSLDKLSSVLNLSNAKLKSGTALINYWSKPCKPTKANGGRTRNLPEHNPKKWQGLSGYCTMDVEAERELLTCLTHIKVPAQEWQLWQLDQRINDTGVAVDMQLVRNAIFIRETHNEYLSERARQLTGLDNPNSLPQLKRWLSDEVRREINDLTKSAVEDLLADDVGSAAREVLRIRQQMGKTSVKKFAAMVEGSMDGVMRGLFQFYGANRTGRWAGRRVQLQNLPRNSMKDLEAARSIVRSGDYELLSMLYSDIPDVLSQLIRTALVPREGRDLIASDFSAIEARVLSWLAGEQWRLDVFTSTGKIYEASASRMFNVPEESITKDSDYRQRGKVAELALGYQGGTGALKAMGGDKLGLSLAEMEVIVQKWRLANPKIVQLWREIGDTALAAVRDGKQYKHSKTGIVFNGTAGLLRIVLPSGRELIYWGARIGENKYGKAAVKYKELNDKKQWVLVDTYGGKLVENITQAVARDLLAHALLRIAEEVPQATLTLHVHDEIGMDAPEQLSAEILEKVEQIMSEPPDWAIGLPLAAEGFVAKFYQK